jgi:hypothetical protein
MNENDEMSTKADSQQEQQQKNEIINENNKRCKILFIGKFLNHFAVI